MSKKNRLFTAITTIALIAACAVGAEPPAHGAALMSKANRPAQAVSSAGDSPVDGGFQFLINRYIGIDDNDLIDEPYGIELDYEIPLSDRGGCRFGLAYEKWEYDDDNVDDDIDMVPLSFSLYYMLAGGSGWGLVGDIGVRYFTSSSSLDMDDDDALALRLGVDARAAFNESISAGIRIGYQAEIDDMEVEDNDVSPGGWMVGIGIFGIL